MLLLIQIPPPDHTVVEHLIDIGKWVGGFAAVGTLIWKIVEFQINKQSEKWKEHRAAFQHEIDGLKDSMRMAHARHEENLATRDDICEECRERVRESLHNIERERSQDILRMKEDISRLELAGTARQGALNLVSQKVDIVAQEVQKLFETHNKQAESLNEIARSLAAITAFQHSKK